MKCQDLHRGHVCQLDPMGVKLGMEVNFQKKLLLGID